MIEVSNPERVMFPSDELTKRDVVEHYERVGKTMVSFLHNRPLTLQRFPKGIQAKGFMQKNAAKHFPDSIVRYPVPKRDGTMTNYPVVTEARDLAYLANQGTLTFHMWTATIETPDRPDWMVIDLDPEADDLTGVRFAIRALRDVLADFGIDGIAMATGSKGFHIWIPLDRALPFGPISLATRALAGLAASRHPQQLTTEFLKKDRAGRVFVDWLRNTGIATVVVPFSIRPRPGAPVAVPIMWDELETAEPGAWSVTRLADRLSVDTSLPAQHVPVEEIVAAARAAGVDLDTPHDRFGRR